MGESKLMGNDYIRKTFVAESQIEQGSTVDLTIMEGKLIITPVQEKSYSLDDLLAGVTKQNLHLEVSTSEPVGKEGW